MRLDRETHTSFSRTELLLQACELGSRLGHLVTQYDRLVRGLSGAEPAAADLDSRVHLVNREFTDLSRRVQELLVLEHDARRQEKGGRTKPVNCRSDGTRQAAPVHQGGRSSVVRPFVSSAYRRAVPATSDSTRIAAVR